MIVIELIQLVYLVKLAAMVWKTLFLCNKCKKKFIAYAPLYFISLQIFQGFVIQSLFILVILKILDEEENPSESFKRLLKEFRFSWNHYNKHTENKKIHSKDLISFFRSLKNELGNFFFLFGCMTIFRFWKIFQ